jgi:hypothetical protein
MSVDNWSLFEMVRGALLTLPEGWAAEQFRSEHPNATFEMMNREILNESGRGVGAPLNVVTGNSSGYNFSSGRLDHLPYQRGITIDRDDFRTIVLDPVLDGLGRAEARMVGQVAGQRAGDRRNGNGRGTGTASTASTRTRTRWPTTAASRTGRARTAEVLSAYGQDWQAHFDQLAREKAYAESKGLPWPILAGQGANSAPPPVDPNSPEQAVAMALESVGLDEHQSAEIMDALAPTFAALRPRNGHRLNGRNGYALPERAN